MSGLLRFHCLWLETKWDVYFHSNALSCHGVEGLVHLFLNCVYIYTTEGCECSWNRSSILIPVSSFHVCVDLRHLKPSLTSVLEVSEWLLCVFVFVCVYVCVCKSHSHRLGCRRFLLAWSLKRGGYHMWRGMCERDSYNHVQISRIIILCELGFSLLVVVPY